MANTFTLISTITVGSGGASSIDFTSIPSTFTDLLVKISSRGTNAAVNPTLVLHLHNDTGATAYSYRVLQGNGSSSSSFNSIQSFAYLGNHSGSTATANTFGNGELYNPNYTSANYKSFSVDSVGENNASTIYAELTANLWSNTAAITKISIIAFSGANFVQYSTASLYGILKA